MKELQRQASPNIVIALAGNKSDLQNKRAIEVEEAQAYADENGLLFMETSAKTATNVNDIFVAIAKKLPKNEQPGPLPNTARRLDQNEGNQQNSSGCCKWKHTEKRPSRLIIAFHLIQHTTIQAHTHLHIYQHPH